MCLTAATFILLLFGLQFTADQVAMQQRCSFLWGRNLSLAPVSLCPVSLVGQTFQKHFKNLTQFLEQKKASNKIAKSSKYKKVNLG